MDEELQGGQLAGPLHIFTSILRFVDGENNIEFGKSIIYGVLVGFITPVFNIWKFSFPYLL